MRRSALVALGLAMAAQGCSDPVPPAPPTVPKEMSEAMAKADAELKVLEDKNRTNNDIVEYLGAYLQRKDHLIFVRDFIGARLWIFPDSTPWIINCGLGVSVFFGPVPNPDASDVNSSSPELKLSMVPMQRERCEELGPRLAHQLQWSDH